MSLPVTAVGLGVRGPRGPVFQGVDLDVPAGALVAVRGPSGSGRSCLLLTLAGRMRPTSGSLRVGELDVPGRIRAVQKVVGIGVFRGVNDLDEPLTVTDMVREQLSLRRFLRHGRPDRVLERVGLDVPGSRRVRELTPAEHVLLGAALALVSDPEVLVIDDVDTGSDAADQVEIWKRLRHLADSDLTVLASCLDAGVAQDTGLIDQTYSLTASEAESARG